MNHKPQKSGSDIPQSKRLQALAELLPRFDEADAVFGEWAKSTEVEPGVMTMPFYAYSDLGHSFVQTAYDFGWVGGEAGFDWGKWMSTPEALRLRDDPEAIPSATPEQLRRLITVVVRQDRFCEGALAGAFESGLLTAIVRRAAELAAEEEAETQ